MMDAKDGIRITEEEMLEFFEWLYANRGWIFNDSSPNKDQIVQYFREFQEEKKKKEEGYNIDKDPLDVE